MPEPVKCPACHRYTTPVCAYCGVCLESSADDKLLDEAEKIVEAFIYRVQPRKDAPYDEQIEKAKYLLTRLRERRAGK